jgi:SOS response regulatory protein OraA/RecX
LSAIGYPSLMFRLTDRQSAAVAKREEYLGIRRHRTQFSDRDDFQAYWDLLDRRCAAVSHQRSTDTPESIAERRKRKQAAILRYYNDELHLLEYAKAYHQRYHPSTARLRMNLVRKCGNAELSETVLERMRHLIDDDARALELAEFLQGQGRNANDIRTKLSQRRFTAETIARCLAAVSDDSGSAWDADALTRKVMLLKRKGLSLQAIRRKLIERPADAEPVAAAMAQVFNDEGDDANVAAEIAKLRRKKLDDKTMYRRLMTKGFAYAAIKAALSETSE